MTRQHTFHNPRLPPIPEPRAAGEEDDEQDQASEGESKTTVAFGSGIAHANIIPKSRRRALTS